MWLADGWKDYEVIDCSKGEKLERWGEYLLVRPDPQVIWDTPKKHKGWKKMNGHYHRSSKGGGCAVVDEEGSMVHFLINARLRPGMDSPVFLLLSGSMDVPWPVRSQRGFLIKIHNPIMDLAPALEHGAGQNP